MATAEPKPANLLSFIYFTRFDPKYGADIACNLILFIVSYFRRLFLVFCPIKNPCCPNKAAGEGGWFKQGII